MMAVVGAMIQYLYTGQDISFKLIVKSCVNCETISEGDDSDWELEREGVQYILINPKKNGTMTARSVSKRGKRRSR